MRYITILTRMVMTVGQLVYVCNLCQYSQKKEPYTTLYIVMIINQYAQSIDALSNYTNVIELSLSYVLLIIQLIMSISHPLSMVYSSVCHCKFHRFYNRQCKSFCLHPAHSHSLTSNYACIKQNIDRIKKEKSQNASQQDT